MVIIKKQLVSQSIINKRSYGDSNPINSITIHQTGNTNKGANAQAHANIQTNLNPRKASWHYQVDDKEIIQSFEDNVQCWHATDGRGPGNLTSIAIEICINSDGDYKKAVLNAAELTKHLMHKYKLGIDKVKQHHDWYNKDCPKQLRAGYMGITWTGFKNVVSGINISATEPKELVKSESLEIDGYLGQLTIKALQRYFGTIVDGKISSPSMVVKALQKLLSVKQDGYMGPITISAMQKRFGTPIDGKISKPSLVIKELQLRLNKGQL